MVLALLLPLLTAVPSAAQAGSSAFDGDPATTERILAGDPAAAALEVSRDESADLSERLAMLTNALADERAELAETRDTAAGLRDQILALSASLTDAEAKQTDTLALLADLRDRLAGEEETRSAAESSKALE